ncbi:MAG: hypothetical protein V8R46_08915 [Eubacterium ramulus]
MSILYRKKEFLELCYRGEELCAMREEVRLPSNKPNIRQLLWQQAQLFGMKSVWQPGSDCTGRITGVCHLSGCRKTACSGQRCAFRISAGWIFRNFPGYGAYPTADPGAIRCSVQADADGEERVILAEADIPIRMWLYPDISKNQLEDANSLEKQLIPKRKPVKIRQLHMKNESQCRVNDTLQIKNTEEEVLQIGAGFGTVEPEHGRFRQKL